MDLDDQRVGAGRDRRERERRDERCVAAGVARIDDHREVRLALEHRDGGDVERVAGGAFERADAALAQHDVAIAGGHDVLGGHQQLADRGRQPALEEYRPLHAADLGQQGEVLHVARADLQHVRVLGHQLDVARVEHLGDHRHPGRRADLDEQFQRRAAESLETVRRRPRLERAAAQDRRAGRAHGERGGVQHSAVLDRAGPGDHGDLRPADPRVVADADDRRLGGELARGTLVRLEHRHDQLDARQRAERDLEQPCFVADAADDRALLAAREVRVQPRALDALADVIELGVGDVGTRDDDHAGMPGRGGKHERPVECPRAVVGGRR